MGVISHLYILRKDSVGAAKKLRSVQSGQIRQFTLFDQSHKKSCRKNSKIKLSKRGER